MSRVLFLVVLCALLAVIRLTLLALTAALLLLLVYALVTRPAQTLAFLGALVLLVVASARPLAFIVALAVVGLTLVLAGSWRRRATPLRLMDQRKTRPR